MIELYKIVEGNQSWFLTSADEDYEYLGDNYVTTTIGRDEAESKNELSKANLEVKLNIDHPLARRHLRTVVDASVGLTVFGVDGPDVNVVWKGRLANVKPDVADVNLIFESIFTSLRRPGLRARFQRMCRHMLYGRGCRLDREDWAVDAEVTAATSRTVFTIPEAATQPNGHWTTGMLEGPDGSLRYIIRHVGDQITLVRNSEATWDEFQDTGGPVAVRLFPGCNRTRERCNGFFNNLPNFGGFPFIPTRNPMDGSSIV
ncbi:tail assembly protein [Stenotrophomonas phage vB_SmaS_Bhz59]